ncbi:NAD(P)-dependent oxidoreductase [Enterococcus sp. 2201sp1_2201st1_B8_2201SCRN_220225]|uniref:NAD(P)-dependent oxidoreductase n=1 Tax=unclassified Enterococcus TaxID=2608891 RepID=UPI0034A47980
MTNYILSQRDFRPDLLEKIKEIAPNYRFETDASKVDWQKVKITIGWQKDWQPLLEKNQNLAWIQSLSAGVDTLPLDTFQKRGILLSNASGIHTRSITEHLLACLLMDVRDFPKAIYNQQKQIWDKSNLHYGYLNEQKIVIVGTGQIGQTLAYSLESLGAQAVGINTSGHSVNNFAKTASIDHLAREVADADYVINILPLTEKTYHLYNHDFFAVMNSKAAFLNVGRGASVETAALTEALQNGQIRQAYLDVLEEEPLASNHPLWTMENCFITPHIAGMTPHFQNAFMDIFLANLESFVKDGSLVKNQVKLSAGY